MLGDKMRRILLVIAVALLLAASLAQGGMTFSLTAVAERDTGNAASTPTTQATEWHGLPANNPGHDDDFDTDSAGGQGGVADELHGVGDAPQNGGRDDEPPACDFHGGFNGDKSQCVDD